MNKVFSILLSAVVCSSLSSCATILNGLSKKSNVNMYLAPNDVQAKINGSAAEISSVSYADNTTSLGGGIGLKTSYYTRAIMIPKDVYQQSIKTETPLQVEISSASLNKTASFQLVPKKYGGYFFLNLITFPVLGHIIDGTTHNNRTLRPYYIDVPSALEGKPVEEWRKVNALRRAQTRKIRKNK